MATTNATHSPETMTTTAMDEPEKIPDEGSKLRMFLSILRKFVGVADIASVRFSLPAQLLEPRPNLEYWTYLDRPEYFAAIGESDEPLDRMLEVLRFWFTKDVKYIKGKPCKPYNSALGEFFRCAWEVTDAPPVISALRPAASSAGSAASSTKSLKNTPLHSRSSSVAATPASTRLDQPVTISYLTEQTSHHPPVSAFTVYCPAKGLSARGFDQISAKFTGTSVKVSPGEHNYGIFITLEQRSNEEYQLTHPAAHLGGLLRGSLTVTVGDQCYITCPKTRMKTILHYIEEGWLGKAQNRVEGVIFRYDPESDDKTKIKDVPEQDVLARISGNWKDKLYVSLGPKAPDPFILLDTEPLQVAPKEVPPIDKQLDNESLRFWGGVTKAIEAKQFSKATAVKQDIEEAQRERTKARETRGVEWRPRFFTETVTPLGKPELNESGRKVLADLQTKTWDLAPAVEQ